MIPEAPLSDVASRAPDVRPDPMQHLAGIEALLHGDEGIDSEFWRAAVQYPDHVAVSGQGQATTYRELADLCQRAAQHVQIRADADRDRPVLILARRSLALVASMLATCRAGRTFAVLDAAYPAQRLQQQCAILNPGLIIGAGVSEKELSEIFGRVSDAPCWALDPRNVPQASGPAWPDPLPHHTAYLLFTSGTTGTPKCIATGHAPLLHFIEFYQQTFKPAPHDRFSMLSGLGHDPLLRDIFVPLSCGARICVPDEASIRAPAELFGWLAAEGVSYIHATPQLIRLITAGQGDDVQLDALRYVYSGGDALSPELVRVLREAAPQAEIVNFYGSSETPQAMAFHRVGDLKRDDPIPLGQGISGVQLLVLTDDLRLADIGELGQIAIRTHFLSDGYRGDDDATSKKYRVSPFTRDPNDVIYLTGDYGAYRDDGAVIGHGRMDDQVKIRGYRVELGEVVRAIEATGLVGNLTLLVQSAALGENQLIAFLIPKNAASRDEATLARLRQVVGAALPAYMVPARWVWIDAMPLTPVGKVDRQALAQVLQAQRNEAGPGLRNDPQLDVRMRRIIAEIEDALECNINRLDVSFVQLGGDSLSYIQVSMVIEEVLGSLPSGWERRPLEVFLELLPEEGGQSSASAFVRIEFALLLRCLSIIMVVANHAAGGVAFIATSALFVVSGVNFSRFLAPGILRDGRLEPLGRFILRFAVPAALWQMLRSVWMHAFWLPSLLLMGTFFQRPGAPLYTFWYLDVLAANLLLMALIAVAARRWVESDRKSDEVLLSRYAFSTLLVLAGLSMATLQVTSGWWDGELGRDSVSPFKWFWLLALGWMVSESDNRQRRLWSSAITVGVSLAVMLSQPVAHVLGGMVDALFALAVLVLLWFPHVSIPRILHKPVILVASSTLFIYITNYSLIYHVLPKLHVPRNLVLEILAALLTGILVTRMWNVFTALLGRMVLWRNRRVARGDVHLGPSP